MKKISMVLFLISCIFLAGCAPKVEEVLEVDGGITDRSDEDAPKEIQSKDITEFTTFFVVQTEDNPPELKSFHIKIYPDESEEYILEILGAFNFKKTVDEEILKDMQQIIDDYNLVQMNGRGKVTSGLSAEFEPWGMTVVYESGERLNFYEDGNPDADWTAALRDYFTDIMIQDGYLEPPQENLEEEWDEEWDEEEEFIQEEDLTEESDVVE